MKMKRVLLWAVVAGLAGIVWAEEVTVEGRIFCRQAGTEAGRSDTFLITAANQFIWLGSNNTIPGSGIDLTPFVDKQVKVTGEGTMEGSQVRMKKVIKVEPVSAPAAVQ